MTNLQIYRGIENVVSPEIIKNPLVEEIIKHLEEIIFSRYDIDDLEYKKLMDHKPTLNSPQIFEISKYIAKLEACGAIKDYLAQLIQTSYDLGNNNFIIDNNQEDDLAIQLIGTSENILNIKMLSNMGGLLGMNSKYCHIRAEQNVEYTGFDFNNCLVDIKYDLEELSLDHSFNSTFRIRGQIKELYLGIDAYGNSKYEKIKLILNPEECTKYEYLEDDSEITLEVLEE